MSYYEFTIKIPDTFRDKLIKRLADAGCLGVIEQDEAITVYFPETVDISAITGDLSLLNTLLEKSGQARGLFFSHALIPEQDWNESWKKGFLQIDVGERFTILPPWEKIRDGRINLVIDPGMAFGTGHHETTRSCLVLMDAYAGAGVKERFLDLGTGTGLLAIAASKLGFRSVIAVDTDPLSIEAAKQNIELNHAADIELFRGSIADVDGTFNIIAANIISGVLVRLAPDIASCLSPAGIAILSGILAEQANEVIAAYEQSGMTIRQLFPDGKWVSIVAGR